jgi:hypothetical protein
MTSRKREKNKTKELEVMTLSLDSLGGYFSRWVKKATGQSRSLVVEWYREKKKEKKVRKKRTATR